MVVATVSLDPTATHLPILREILATGKVKKVLEFGCGLFSTKQFVDAGCEVTAIEMQNEDWYRRVKDALPSVNLHLCLGPMAWKELPLDDRYDLIFVDGHGDSRPDCMMWAKDHTDLIVAHDTEHPYYQWERADMSGFVKKVHDGLSPTTTTWTRNSKISLILPYWDRQEIADKAFALLDKHYAGLDLEVIVVDDGNAVPFRVPQTRLNVVVVTLPRKDEPKAQPTCWNAGVAAATGEIIVLSCVEILHEQPVLEQLAQALREGGESAYVLAAAWCPEMQEWHCHSSYEPDFVPAGTGGSYCAALYKSLFNKAGGFDEEYRDGAGFEDKDFIYRMLHAGAKFIKRDDLVVIHPKDGAHIEWKTEPFLRNKAIFERKWMSNKKVTFCCVQAQNYCGRGAQYVNTLYDMVKRNLLPGYDCRFVCLTDDATGLNDAIDTIPLPADLEGWYGKLYLFKRGLFRDGERIVYLDLDTLIVGALDEILRYDGQFATLEDFYFPQQIGPAVMLWEAGDYTASVWDEWCASGQPRNPMGDLWWLNNVGQGRFAKQSDKLQRLYPKTFVSYKRDCAPYPPHGAKVVCFHGLPRPHEAAEMYEWVDLAWRVGGFVKANLQVVANTAYEETARNIAAACKRFLPWLPIKDPHSVAIVGGAPSLERMLPELRQKQSKGMEIFAVNGAHDYLLENGIVPDAHVIIDARAENVRFITKPAKHYYLASQCHPDVFDAAKADTTVIHMNTHGVLASIPVNGKPVNLISSGSTVGLAAMAIAYCLGHRRMFIYGMDSSYEEDRHAYKQSLNDADRVVEVQAGGRKFKCAPWMVAQVEAFQKLSVELARAGCEINVRCSGLLGHVSWLMVNQAEAA